MTNRILMITVCFYFKFPVNFSVPIRMYNPLGQEKIPNNFSKEKEKYLIINTFLRFSAKKWASLIKKL